jgi:hypothetical protein
LLHAGQEHGLHFRFVVSHGFLILHFAAPDERT